MNTPLPYSEPVATGSVDPAQIDKNRAASYQLLARLWSKEVDEQLWDTIGNTPLVVPEDESSLGEALAALQAFIEENSALGNESGHGGFGAQDPSYNSPAFKNDCKPQIIRLLASDYAVLCRGVNRQKGADPYESVHRNPLGLMMQDEWEDVVRLYREAGIARSSDATEPEDHLGSELEAMALLCLQSCNPDLDETRRAKALDYQRTLLDEHLRQWVPSFVKRVDKYASTDFYRSIARITEAYLSLDSEYLSGD